MCVCARRFVAKQERKKKRKKASRVSRSYSAHRKYTNQCTDVFIEATTITRYDFLLIQRRINERCTKFSLHCGHRTHRRRHHLKSIIKYHSKAKHSSMKMIGCSSHQKRNQSIKRRQHRSSINILILSKIYSSNMPVRTCCFSFLA